MTCPSSVPVPSRQLAVPWPPTGHRIHTPGRTDSGKGLVQASFVSSEPFGKGIVGACPLDPAHLLPQAKGTMEKARGSSAQSDP